jgi:hypothetical protein
LRRTRRRFRSTRRLPASPSVTLFYALASRSVSSSAPVGHIHSCSFSILISLRSNGQHRGWYSTTPARKSEHWRQVLRSLTPSKSIQEHSKSIYIPRGINTDALDRSLQWDFKPTTFKVPDIILRPSLPNSALGWRPHLWRRHFRQCI